MEIERKLDNTCCSCVQGVVVVLAAHSKLSIRCLSEGLWIVCLSAVLISAVI